MADLKFQTLRITDECPVLLPNVTKAKEAVPKVALRLAKLKHVVSKKAAITLRLAEIKLASRLP